ncbi:hypothetical protein RFUL19S_05203 [Rhizobacter fulvus]
MESCDERAPPDCGIATGPPVQPQAVFRHPRIDRLGRSIESAQVLAARSRGAAAPAVRTAPGCPGPRPPRPRVAGTRGTAARALRTAVHRGGPRRPATGARVPAEAAGRHRLHRVQSRTAQVDPFDEVAYLGLECDLAGAAWIGRHLLAGLSAQLRTRPSRRLMLLYTALRALLRSRLVMAHLLDPHPRSPDRWMPLAQRYVQRALDVLDELEGGPCGDHLEVAQGRGTSAPLT